MPNVQVGSDVVFFPDSMTDEQIARAIQDAKIAQLPKGIPTAATVEPAAAMAAGLAGEVVGGLSGLARSGYGMVTGEGSEEALRKGAETSESVSQNISSLGRPRTQYGAKSARALGELLQPVAEGFQDLSKKAGDFAFEASGGSPAAGAAGYTAPTAVLEALGLSGLRRVMPNIQFLDAAGNPTPELLGALREMGLSWSDLADTAKAKVPADPGRTLITGQRKPLEMSLGGTRAAQIEAGGSEAALAPLMLDRAGRTTSDPMAQEAIKQWDDEGLVQAVKTSTPETQQKMLEMLDLRQRISQNKRLAMQERPSDIAGNAAVSRVNYLRDLANESRRELNRIANNQLAGKPMDTQPVLTAVNNALETLDVGLVRGEDGLPKPVFEGSMISQNKSSQRIINSLFNLLKEGGAPDALRFHKLKRQLDELIDYKKSMQGGLTDSGRDVLKTVRRSLNDALRSVNDDYARVNDVFSDVLTVFDDLDSVSGRRTNIFDAGAGQSIGRELRKISSNYGVQRDMREAINNLESAANKYGANFNDSITDLAMFATALDTRFGPVAETSFAGDIARMSKRSQAEEATRRAAEQGFTRTAMDKVMEAYQGARGVNEQKAYGIMEELLKRNGQ